MLVQNKKIAIVGGGMGGLTLARLLQMQNVNVKVYERDVNREVRVQGTPLDLHEDSGLEAIKRAGLLEEFYKKHRPMASRMKVLDKTFSVKFSDHDKEQSTSEIRPEIDRAPLRDILLDCLKPDTIVWNSHFVSMEKEKNGWILHFKNGTNVYADLVIAADGANSRVRSYLTTEKPVYAGVTLIEGTIYNAEKNAPKLFEFAKGGKVMAFSNEQMLTYGTKGDGTLMFIASSRMPENWITESSIDFKNKDQVFEWFKKIYAGWSDQWDELFTSDEAYFIPRPQYYFLLNQTWETQENLTMLGDAAHRMPPFAGKGANLAMQDAFELAECLTNERNSDIKTVLSHFEKQMQQRAAEATKETLENMEKLHSKIALESLLQMFSTGSES